MSNSVNIRDLQSLEQLRIAIAKFCEESEDHVQSIDSALQTRLENLSSLEFQFKSAVESAEEDYRSAKDALIACESDIDEDDEGDTVYPDCDYEREEAIESRRKLDTAASKYNDFKREINRLKECLTEFHKPKIKYRSFIQYEKESATDCLKQLINGAENYLDVSAPQDNSNYNGQRQSSHSDNSIVVSDKSLINDYAEILVMGGFSFIGATGKDYNIKNKINKDLVISTYNDNESEHVCSELKIEKTGSGNYGKIISVNIPPSLQNERIGKHLISNLEATCRANDCKEISGWAGSNNVNFYTGLNYQIRNEIKEAGVSIYKCLNSTFLSSQNKAKEAFQNKKDFGFIKYVDLGKLEVNPLNIITPDGINEPRFWTQHENEGKQRYFDLIEKYDQCRNEMQKNKSLDEIRKENFWVANAYDIFHGSEPIRLLKSGDYYQIDSNGRHRVAAAQEYYLQTGKIIPLTADVNEMQ